MNYHRIPIQTNYVAVTVVRFVASQGSPQGILLLHKINASSNLYPHAFRAKYAGKNGLLRRKTIRSHVSFLDEGQKSTANLRPEVCVVRCAFTMAVSVYEI